MKERVELLDGKMEIQSQIGVGTCVMICSDKISILGLVSLEKFY